MATETGRKLPMKRHILTAVMAVTIALCGGQATSWAGTSGYAAAATAPAAQNEGAGALSKAHTPSSQPSSQPSSVEETYASREASASELQSFKGGDVVIIGSTGLVIVLLVILILVVA